METRFTPNQIPSSDSALLPIKMSPRYREFGEVLQRNIYITRELKAVNLLRCLICFCITKINGNVEGCSNLFFLGGGRKSVTVFKVHGKLFRRIAVLESTLTQFALPAMLTNGLHRAVSPHCAAQNARRLKGLRRPRSRRGARIRVHTRTSETRKRRGIVHLITNSIKMNASSETNSTYLH